MNRINFGASEDARIACLCNCVLNRLHKLETGNLITKIYDFLATLIQKIKDCAFTIIEKLSKF